MTSFIEALYKTASSIQFAWIPEAGAVSYNVYVSLGPDPSLLQLLATGIDINPSTAIPSRGKVVYTAQVADVQSLLGIPSTQDFSNKLFYFAVTYYDSLGSEQGPAAIVPVPPVGIVSKTMRDDPTINRHGYVFSNDDQRWIKMAGSSSGAVIVNTADFYKTNLTSEYTWDGTNLTVIKSYPSDATSVGMPCKLTVNTYLGSQLVKISITDSTI